MVLDGSAWWNMSLFAVVPN